MRLLLLSPALPRDCAPSQSAISGSILIGLAASSEIRTELSPISPRPTPMKMIASVAVSSYIPRGSQSHRLIEARGNCASDAEDIYVDFLRTFALFS